MDRYNPEITSIISKNYESISELMSGCLPGEDEDKQRGDNNGEIFGDKLLIADGLGNHGNVNVSLALGQENAKNLDSVQIKSENTFDEGFFGGPINYEDQSTGTAASHKSKYRPILPKGSEIENALGFQVNSETGAVIPILKLHICTLCGDVCRSSWKLMTHTKKKHNQDQPYVCPECGLQENDKDAMKRHFRVHVPPPPKMYQCSICPASFCVPSKLESHSWIHKGNKPYTCGLCNKSFTLSGGLRDHLKIHTGERPHVCKFCDKTFPDTSKLKNHLRIHTGERPHVCKYCGKGFIESGKLKRHIRTHTGEQPYKCDFCGRGFNVISNLHKHMTIHNGEKPFTCKICGRGFAQKVNLKSHARIHTGEKDPYKCEICGKIFDKISKSKSSHACIDSGIKTVKKDEGSGKKDQTKNKRVSRKGMKYKKKGKGDKPNQIVENLIKKEPDCQLEDTCKGDNSKIGEEMFIKQEPECQVEDVNKGDNSETVFEIMIKQEPECQYINGTSTVLSNYSDGDLDTEKEKQNDDKVMDFQFGDEIMRIKSEESEEQNLTDGIENIVKHHFNDYQIFRNNDGDHELYSNKINEDGSEMINEDVMMS